MRTAPNAVRVALLWLAGIDLRLTLLAVPPVIPLIHRDLHLNESGIAALSNLPVLVLAGSSVFGALLTTRLGARRAMVVGLWVIALSSALRGVGPSIAMLFARDAGDGHRHRDDPAGVSVARARVVRRAHRAGHRDLGERAAVRRGDQRVADDPVHLAAGRRLVGAQLRRVEHPRRRHRARARLRARSATDGAHRANGTWLPDFRDRRVWLLGVFQSAASMTYFGANTFLPDFLHATGQGGLVGASLAALNIGQLPASIAVGFIPMRILGRRATSLLVAALIVAALAGVVLFGGAVAVAAAALLGLTGAYVLTMSFALPALIAPPAQIARLAAGTFTLGYAISFVMTLLSGAAWDATHAPAAAFVPMLAGGRHRRGARARGWARSWRAPRASAG